MLRLWWYTAQRFCIYHQSFWCTTTPYIVLKCQLIISRQALCLAETLLLTKVRIFVFLFTGRPTLRGRDAWQGAWQVSEPWGHRIAVTQMPPDIFGRTGRDDWIGVPRNAHYSFSKCTLGLASRSAWLWVLHRLGSDWEMWTGHQDKMRGDKVQNKTQWWYVSSHFQSVPPLVLFSSEATFFNSHPKQT